LKSVLDVLSDEKEHRNKEIKKKTGLNDATLNKHLKYLYKEKKAIDRRQDNDSGKYPPPVYYKIKPITKAVLDVISTTEQEKHEIERIVLDSKKTPLDVLDQINEKNNNSILLALKIYKENKDVSPDFLDSMLTLFLYQPYATLTSFLIEQSQKIIEKIDVESLIESNKSTIRIGKNDLKSLVESLGKSLGLTDDLIDNLADDLIAKIAKFRGD
jgi:predicted transcriptional regulator